MVRVLHNSSFATSVKEGPIIQNISIKLSNATRQKKISTLSKCVILHKPIVFRSYDNNCAKRHDFFVTCCAGS